MKRRPFLVNLTLAALSLLVWPSTALARTVRIPLSKLPRLRKVGGHAAFKLRGEPLLVIRDTEKTVRAIRPVCTHKACKVKFDGKQLQCTCHKSAFDLDGRRLSGPARQPLKIYDARLTEDGVVISLEEKIP